MYLAELMGSPVLGIGFPGGLEFLVLGVVVLVLFGHRLPSAMKSLGQSFTEFKKGINEGEKESDSP